MTTRECIKNDWEVIIGLEIHVQLNTKTKLFSRTANQFGCEPNTNIGLTDTAQPGSLPLLNKAAVEKAIALGCALNSEISSFSAFDRKSYFYPDSPRNFQITQFFHPILKKGSIKVSTNDIIKEFFITQAHLEDDAGMLRHFSSFTGIDYNRAGAPLIEIVTEPCIHSAKEASALASTLRLLLIYLNVSSCNMEEGAMRFDVNISVRKKGEDGLRTKTEIKNLNSFSNMEMAIEAETSRQIKLYEAHPEKNPKEVVESITLRFDLPTKQTIEMRSKIQAEDYRYFPEPDLPPLYITASWIESVKATLPELPEARYQRYLQSLGLSEYSATLLIHDKTLCDFFELGLKKCSNARTLCNWITVEFIGRLKECNKTLAELGLLPEHIAELINLIDEKVITGKLAKSVADQMILFPKKSPKELIALNPDLVPLNEEEKIITLIDEVLSKNPQSVSDYKKGMHKSFHYLFGQIMQACKEKASPGMLKDLLTKKLDTF